MKISLIVAMSRNRVIGRDNALPWRLPADLARFKRITMGHHLIMGRKTWDSLGRPLPDRTTIVLSGRPGFAPPGAIAASSLDGALGRCAGDEVFVAGGAEVFRAALPRADRIYMTLIHADISGDTHFPEFDESEWAVTSREEHPADERNPHAYTFLIYDRKP
jgi:dihydrofolate reductase